MFKRTARLAVGAIVVAGTGAALFSGGAVARQTHQGANQVPTYARDLPAGMAKTGRWVTVHGRRIWGIPLSLQVSRKSGQLNAHVGGAQSGLGNLTTALCVSSYPSYQGAQMTQWTCNGSPNQTWYLFENISYGNTWEIINAGDGACMNNYQNRTNDGNPQIMWACESGSTIPLTRWVGVSNWGAYYLIHNDMLTGTPSNECLSDLGNSAQGSPMVQWTCNRGSSNQAFSGATLNNM